MYLYFYIEIYFPMHFKYHDATLAPLYLVALRWVMSSRFQPSSEAFTGPCSNNTFILSSWGVPFEQTMNQGNWLCFYLYNKGLKANQVQRSNFKGLHFITPVELLFPITNLELWCHQKEISRLTFRKYLLRKYSWISLPSSYLCFHWLHMQNKSRDISAFILSFHQLIYSHILSFLS